MSGDDLVREASAELYGADPDEFVERRNALVAGARKAGEPRAAKTIAGLRKPTRSAWMLNNLVRAAPDATQDLAALGNELRAAQAALDGAALRELSQRRNKLIGSLARRAFTESGQPAPSAALRDEVTGTLAAALADPQVARELQAGTLARAARPEGFGPDEFIGSGEGAGPAEAPVLAFRTPPAAAGSRPAAPPAAKRKASVTALADARARAERERRRQALEQARQAAAEADRAASAAADAERERENAVRLVEQQLSKIEQQLNEARRQLNETRQLGRRARSAQHRAHQALDHLEKQPAHEPGASGARRR
ncbi:MAG TPA: hypothetical protein VG253_20160 [Streptosporangiaceae bacterium]|nr:hypothetical protein [Streptosporangiaceae bacterium]